MERQLPLITVVGLCYNQSQYVLETLESIRMQSYSNLQVIILDDCSRDDSVTIIARWLQKHELNWTFIKHNQNKGITKSLNETLNLAKGEYFKVIACDDIMLPNFISTMVDRIDCLPEEYAMIYSDVQTINENSELFGITPFTERGWDEERKIPSGMIFEKLVSWCFIPAPSTLVRTKVLQEIRFDETLMIEDWDMWLSISKRYLIIGIPVIGINYRIHNASMYQQRSPAFRDHELRTVQKHLGHSKLADKKIKEFIYLESMILYMNNGNRSSYWLWTRFRMKKTFRNFIHFTIAAFKIEYSIKEKLITLWK